MDRPRYIGQLKIAKDFSSKVIRVDEKDIKGYASFIKIHEVYHPIIVNDFCICYKGYSTTGFLPDALDNDEITREDFDMVYMTEFCSRLRMLLEDGVGLRL